MPGYCRRDPAWAETIVLPKKQDRLSSSIASDIVINGFRCEVACYGSGNDFVCRITRHDAKPIQSEWNDGYHPPPDAGMLWIRSFDGDCLITGFVQRLMFPKSDDLHQTLDLIQQMLTVDQVQSKVNVRVLGSTKLFSLEFNGEQIDSSYR